MKERIRQRAFELGFDDCRFARAGLPATAELFRQWLAAGWHGTMGWLARSASRRADPQQVLPGARSMIVVAASYAEGPPPPPGCPAPPATGASGPPTAAGAGRPTGVIARYARGADYHALLGARLEALGAFVNQLGGPGTRSVGYVDTGPILEREFAQRAGLGFVGKHTNLISRRFGNWILLGELLTTLELEPDAPERNRCGACARCLTACPTGAIVAPFRLDARRCIAYLTIELHGPIPVELRPAVGNRIFGCDDCLAACPWNRFARAGQLLRAGARPDLGQPDLLELLALDAAGFDRRFAGTPLARLKWRRLRRNVCVALGNVGGDAALPALDRLAADPDPLLAEHARWAREQIARRCRCG